MKRIISIFLCALLCLSFSSAFVGATSLDEDELPDVVIGSDTVCAEGDVTGDGKVNLGDVARLYGHLRGSNPLTDSKALELADFTGEGRLNMGDVAKLYAHVRGTAEL